MSEFLETKGAADKTETKPPVTTETKEEKKETKTAIVLAQEDEPPLSRVFHDPALWSEALGLATMLTYCRPEGSRSEQAFINRYIVPLKPTFDKYGNSYVKIGDKPNVLWSCHTDTVHNAGGGQKVEYYPDLKTGEIWFQVAAKSKSNCLGADDTCGVWLMLEMIKAKIPGLYIFHREEEVGRRGSKWIADKNKDALADIKYAIAFDRKGTKSIITHQTGKRCCSDEFAKSLAEQLGMGHACDTTGSYTDTASYVDLIPECTNLSVGYEDAHWNREKTNVDYLFDLRDAMLKLDVSKLVEKRKAGENSYLSRSWSYTDNGGSYYWNKPSEKAVRNLKLDGGTFDELEKHHKDDDVKVFQMYHWDHKESKYVPDKPILERLNALNNKSKHVIGFTAVELTRKHKGNFWQKDYEWDAAVGLWFPKKKNGKVGAKKRDFGNRQKLTFTEFQELVRRNPGVIADFLEMEGYDPREIQDYIWDCSQQYYGH